MPTDASSTPHDSIALLIDADNAPASKIDFIISELASYGVVNIRRAYGNWKKSELQGWEKVLHDYAIQPVQHFDLIKGKNASDMALLIDAMDILYTKSVGTFCLVSSDCDFTPLILRLRADGKQVIGFGGKTAPEPFVNSCTRFLYLEDERKPRERANEKDEVGDRLKRDTRLINLLRNAVEAQEDDDGWAPLGGVGSHIRNQGSFDQRNYGFAKLSGLFGAIPLFEVKSTQTPNGTSYWVRLKK
ncbi:hypothetical protein DB347_04645 [Opitutaceae bacterium EW11]|nr:hypothetical protein DB347_04645 [Opitutaceae bacterium EW11]